MQARKFTRKRAHGFTLIELMIVVVIVGILSALGIYGVRNYINKAKTAEAREVVGTIMAQQEAFFDETGRYLDVNGGVAADGDYYPDGTFDGDIKIMWGADDGCTGLALDNSTAVACGQGYRTLGVTVSSAVRFRYATTIFDVGDEPPVPGTYVTDYNPDSVTATRPGFVVVALSDLSGDTRRSAVVGSSLQADLYGENLGE